MIEGLKAKSLKFKVWEICLILILFYFLFSIFYFPKKTEAQLATVEVNAGIHLPILTGRAFAETQASLAEIAFQALKKRMFDMVVDQIIDYINGNGEPRFITDWQGFLEGVGQIAVGDFVQAIGLGALCSPFRLQVQIAMVAPPRFSRQITCTLGTIVRNVENFYSDFRNGGWLAYQEMWAPNNNFYGSMILAWNAKDNEVAARLSAAHNEAMASQGFLSVKKCAKDANGRDIPRTCVITTPGTAIGALTQKAIGADLDFIINSQDLAAYIAAISDALINRLIRSGVEGLGGVVTRSAPSRGYNNGIGCDAFIGRAQQDCLSYQNYYGSSYTKASDITLKEIDRALQPRLAAKQILDGLVGLEGQVLDGLNNLFFCQSLRSQPKDDTNNSLIQVSQNFERHRTLKIENDRIVNQLTLAAENIGQSSQSNFGGIFLAKEMTDVKTANEVLAAAQAEQSAHQPLLNELNNSLPARLNQCQAQ